MNANTKRSPNWVMRHYWELCWSLFVIVVFLVPFTYRTIPDMKQQHVSTFSRENWRPGRTYLPQIEDALAILAQYAPDQAATVRNCGMPIDIADSSQMNALHMPNSRLAETMTTSGNIYINHKTTNTAPRIAFALYHELVHVQYGIHDTNVYPSSPIARILGRSEEADAHMRTLRFAWRLRNTYPDAAHWVMTGGSPLFLWPLGITIELLTYFWPFGTVVSLFFVALIPWLYSVTFQKRIAEKLSVAVAA